MGRSRSSFAFTETIGGLPKVGAIGDSITANALVTSASSIHFSSIGYISWLRHLSRQAVDISPDNLWATSGFTTTQMISSGYHTSAANAWMDFVIIHAGSNDPSQSVPYATTIANLRTMYDKVLASGARIIAVPIIPRTSYTSARRLHYSRVNRWIYDQAAEDNRILVADPVPYISNAADNDGEPRSGYLSDGIHPTATGAYWYGRVIWETLQKFIAPSYPLFNNPGDTYDATDNPTGNLLTNGILTGTGGTKGGGTQGAISGNVADSWTVDGDSTNDGDLAAVCAKVARTDGISADWQQITLSGTPTAVFGVNLKQTISSNYSVGDTLELLAEYELDTGHSNVLGVIRDLGVSGTYRALDFAYGSATDPWPDPSEMISGVIRTRPFIVPAGLSSSFPAQVGIYCRANVVVSAVVRIGRMSLRKI